MTVAFWKCARQPPLGTTPLRDTLHDNQSLVDNRALRASPLCKLDASTQQHTLCHLKSSTVHLSVHSCQQRLCHYCQQASIYILLSPDPIAQLIGMAASTNPTEQEQPAPEMAEVDPATIDLAYTLDNVLEISKSTPPHQSIRVPY